MRSSYAFDSPNDALAALLCLIEAVPAEACPLASASGRVLARAVVADRPSPACDVSTVDGYAIRLVDLKPGLLAVRGSASIGCEPPRMPEGAALQIVTGAPVPPEAGVVVRREDVGELGDRIELHADAGRIAPGANIRRCGENLGAGVEVVAAGRAITPTIAGALSMFGVATPLLHRMVRVAVLVTGDEVLEARDVPSPWTLRDANGPALASMFARPWCECTITRLPDEKATIAAAVDTALDSADALVLTGGVSMGDRDYVPSVLVDRGCRVLFHKLPQRPGKPLLGAVASGGRPILGLPGNPVSAVVTARRYGLPALARRAGFAQPPGPLEVVVDRPDAEKLGLWWFRLVRTIESGVVSLVPSQGSGDMPSAALADGFIEIPPNATPDQPAPFYAWTF